MKDLTELRKIVENATPGPWIIDSLESGEHGVFIEEGNPDYRKLGCASAIVASHLVGKNADYLEAFDPETVLALLDRLEQAEAAVARVRALCMSTDGDYLDNEETVNTVGDILEALDGDGRA